VPGPNSIRFRADDRPQIDVLRQEFFGDARPATRDRRARQLN
jgi:hypothetical protein